MKHASSRTSITMIAVGAVIVGLILAFLGGVVANSMSEDTDDISDRVTQMDHDHREVINTLVTTDQESQYEICVIGLQAITRNNTLLNALATEQEALVAKGEALGQPRTNQRNRAEIYRAAITSTEGFDCVKPKKES